MVGETIPDGSESLVDQMSFSEVVRNKIASLPAPVEQIDPYQPARRLPGIAIEMSYDLRYRSDGRIDFGKAYDTRQIAGDDLELTYAFSKKTNKPEVLLHRFDKSGLVTRVWFREIEPGVITKSIELPPWSGVLSLDGGPVIHRDVKSKAVARLKLALSAPENFVAELTALSTPTRKEQRQLDARRREQEESNRKLHEDLKAMADARRHAEAEAHNVWLG